ncbi:DOLK (predicted) [Pycnogonum litorale]
MGSPYSQINSVLGSLFPLLDHGFDRSYTNKHSFSIGEASLISQAITIIAVQCILKFPNVFHPVNDASDADNIQLISLVCGTSFGLAVLIIKFIERKTFTGLIIVFILYILPIIGYSNTSVVFWIYKFVSSKSSMMLIFSWIILSVASVMFLSLNLNDYVKKTIKRKFFHLIVVLIYLPGVLIDINLLYLASVAIFMVFILFEYIRAARNPKIIAEKLEFYFSDFIDDKDQGYLVLSHIYLLIGCSSPLWILVSSNIEDNVSALSGVISLGIGDTIASVYGSLYGKHFWPGSKKTVEGTLSSVIAMIIFVVSVNIAGWINLTMHRFLLMTVAVTMTASLESSTNQIDNLILPLYLMSLLVN